MNWPKLSDEELEMLEDLAAVFFTEKQCAIVLEQEQKAFVAAANSPISPIYKAYHKGRLKAIYDVRKNAFAMARNGSSPAQSFVEKLLNDYEFQKTVDQT
jgi:hypothetical protein